MVMEKRGGEGNGLGREAWRNMEILGLGLGFWRKNRGMEIGIRVILGTVAIGGKDAVKVGENDDGI